ncbi:mucin-22-like [Branchiostoma lanceolatum]|uniref:mucin-22-like n=1 Tax=Branchiostoma lanceolatum TaxID=7740 RepID=UPI0034559C65
MVSVVYLALFLVFITEVKCFPAAVNGSDLSGKESRLLTVLQRKFHFNDAEVEATKELIEDEENGVDPKQDKVIFRLQVEEIVRKLRTMSKEEMERIKRLFSRKMGVARADEVFDAAEEIYASEKEANEELEESFKLNEGEEEAFEELVEDTKDGRDPETEDMEFKLGLSELADSYARLSPEQEERFKNLVEEEFGSEEGAKIFEEIREIHEEMEILKANPDGANGISLAAEKINRVADDQENKMFWGELDVDVPDEGNEYNGNFGNNGMEEIEDFGNPNSVQYANASPIEAQNAGANPVQAQNAGANPVQAQNAGANPVQAQSPGANPIQTQSAGANPAQVHVTEANLSQVQAAGVNPNPLQAADVTPQTAGANPTQVQTADAEIIYPKNGTINPSKDNGGIVNTSTSHVHEDLKHNGTSATTASTKQQKTGTPIGSSNTDIGSETTEPETDVRVITTTPVSNISSLVTSAQNETTNSENIFSASTPGNRISTSQPLTDTEHLESPINHTSNNATGTNITTMTVTRERTFAAQTNLSISEDGPQNKLENISGTPTAVPNVATTDNDETNSLNIITTSPSSGNNSVANDNVAVTETDVYSSASVSGQDMDDNSSGGGSLVDIPATVSPTVNAVFPANVTIPVDIADASAAVPTPIGSNSSSTESPFKGMENSKNGDTNQTTAADTATTNATASAEETSDNSVEEDRVSAANVTVGVGDLAGEEGDKNDDDDDWWLWDNLPDWSDDDDDWWLWHYSTTIPMTTESDFNSDADTADNEQ